MYRCTCLLTLGALLGLLGACGHSGNSSLSGMSLSSSSSSSSSGRGQVVSNAQLGSYSQADLLSLLGASTLGQELQTLSYNPLCTVNVFHLEYQTIGGKGEPTSASAAVMVPSGGSGNQCTGARPIVMYAHGTNPNKNFNIGALSTSGDDEGVILAVAFASQGYIVVAPNYAGYDTSPLAYHPYLVADQQAADMIDALQAARSTLPEAAVPGVTDSGKLFITGYSQGGFVAMATHRAMQAAGMTVTASGPMSGPYALAAFGDAVFEGQVNGGAVVNFTMVASAYQNSYGNVYSAPSDIFASPYSSTAPNLLPNTTPISTLYAQNELPQNHLFSSTPPDPQYASITPATTPSNLAPAFALGIGDPALVTNSYRLTYLQDAQANPDGGFPSVTTAVPAASPGMALRQDLKSNDLRSWSPNAPVLLCAGNEDPTVFFFNLQLMQTYWGAHPGSVTPVYVDIDSSGNPYSTEKTEFAIAKNAVAAQAIAQGATDGGQAAVLMAYHTTLVAPFCLSAVKSFFDGYK